MRFKSSQGIQLERYKLTMNRSEIVAIELMASDSVYIENDA